MKHNAVILAGARNTNLVTKESTINYEALVRVMQRPMILYVLQALNMAKKINKIVVIGPKEEEKLLLANGANLVIESKEDIVKNIKLGLQALTDEFSNNQHFLLVSSDIPLVTGEAIDDFIIKCKTSQVEADLYYPIISKERNLAMYPESKRTYVKLKEGTYTGGNLTLISPKIINESTAVINRMIANRKDPLKMTRILGLKFLFKLLCGQLSISEVEDRASELVNSCCKAIITDYPELGFDIDKPEDLELIQKIVINS
ncbi:NTP transferase domain-containing protein [Selenihalanaerobacter shriftii]|uniref:MobA-like NTP transferase domain-containing protein n=1 Tax=Selenihalanaerobacter shriftii TaxID=142842 RepID=A0A1T4N6R7_9FIRM|nr:NTP transferase domain-containing protein [Selenihalanaerobacter shriftii]SJZ74548.1 MobA-like NTP transferase domain-containing protein [Selenihalanaerobacter shriftii]